MEKETKGFGEIRVMTGTNSLLMKTKSAPSSLFILFISVSLIVLFSL